MNWWFQRMPAENAMENWCGTTSGSFVQSVETMLPFPWNKYMKTWIWMRKKRPNTAMWTDISGKKQSDHRLNIIIHIFWSSTQHHPYIYEWSISHHRLIDWLVSYRDGYYRNCRNNRNDRSRFGNWYRNISRTPQKGTEGLWSCLEAWKMNDIIENGGIATEMDVTWTRREFSGHRDGLRSDLAPLLVKPTPLPVRLPVQDMRQRGCFCRRVQK